MPWSARTTATQLTSITTEQFFDQTPTSTPGELFHVEVDVNFPASPTDDALVAVYGTLDGTNWDDTPMFEKRIENSPDPDQASFRITGVYQFRVGVRRSGTTDTLTSADMAFRRDNVDL